MKENIASSVGKEFIYEIYNRTIDNPKQYNKITRKKMIQEVFDYYKKDNNLERCLSYQDILELKETIDNNNISTFRNEHLFKLLLLNFIDYKTFCIHEDILSFIKDKLETFDLDEAKQRDERNNLVIGMIKAYGIIKVVNLEQLINIFSELNEIDLDFERDVLENRVVREYYEIIDDQSSDYIVYKMFVDYFDKCVEIQEDIPYLVKLFEYNSLINIAKYDFDISVPSLKKLYNELEGLKYRYMKDNIKEYLMCLSNLGNYFDDIKQFFISVPHISKILTPKLLKCIENALNEIPLAIFYGMTINEILEKKEEAESNKKYLQSDKQMQACLGGKEAAKFYKMYMSLLDYVNKKYHVIHENHLATAFHVNPQDQVKVRNKMFEDLSIIDEYIKLNPNHLNSTLLKQVGEIKNAIMIDCIIIKYERNFTLIIDDRDILYGIVGGVSNIDEVIPSDVLPYVCKLVLVPYKGKILYDGVIEGSNIQMGPGIQSRIIKGIKNAVIHKSLPITLN